jgi:hypothetical protein
MLQMLHDSDGVLPSLADFVARFKGFRAAFKEVGVFTDVSERIVMATMFPVKKITSRMKSHYLLVTFSHLRVVLIVTVCGAADFLLTPLPYSDQGRQEVPCR